MNKILLIEDEDLLRKAIEFRLKRDGHEVVLAADGRAGMQAIESNDIDLVITDIMLPFNNGLEVVSKVKNRQDQQIPVIVLSSVGLEQTVMEAFRLGADDYITKPFSPAELSIRVSRLIQN